jgi:uncharacterized protein YhaN
MIIKRLNIEGFGFFNNKTVENLEKGVNVVYGKNEAGKSTTLDFIRFTLFGYPRSKAERREPTNGGNHGGTIHLTHSSGQDFSIYRSGNHQFSMELNGEKTTDIASYNQLTNFATNDLFNNIFAITVDELNDLSNLDDSGMTNRIFSMGMGLSNINIGDIEDALRNQADDYFKLRGSNQKLAITTRALDEVEAKITQLQAHVADYETLKAEEKRLATAITEQSIQRDSLQVEKNRLANLLKAYEAFTLWQAGKNTIEQLKEVPKIPEEIVQRVNKDREHVLRLQEVSNEKASKIQAIHVQLEGIQINEALIPHLEHLDYIASNQTKYVDSLARREYINTEEKKITAAKDSIAQSMGEAISTELLLRLTDYVQLRSSAEEQLEKRSTIQRQMERNTIQQEELLLERKEQTLVLDKAKAKHTELAKQIDPLKEQEIEVQAAIEGLKSKEGSVIQGNEQLLFGAILAIVGGAALVFINTYIALVLSSIGLLFILLYLQSRKGGSTSATVPADHSDLLRRRRGIQEQLQAYDDIDKQVKESQIKLEKLEARDDQLKVQAQEIKQQLNENSTTWQQFLEANGLPAFLQANQISTLIATSESVKNYAQQLAHLLQEKDTLAQFIADFDRILSPIAAELGIGLKGVSQIREALVETKEQTKLRTQLNEELAVLEREHATTSANITQAENRLSEYFQEFGATNERAFFEKVELSKQKLANQEEVLQAEKSIALLMGPNEVNNTIDALEQQTKSSLERELLAKEKDYTALSEALSEQRETLGSLRERITRLLNVDEMFELQNEREALKTQLVEEYHAWMIQKVALAVLEKEKLQYEKEKQPSVIKYASAIFSQLTNNAYQRISSSLTHNEVKLFTDQGAEREVYQLSRGTKEQLLIALRLGFIQAYEEKSEPLPLVLDDIMVNFDNERASQFADILLDFAKNRQAIVFTCHEHIRNLFQEKGAKIVSDTY